MSAAARPPGLRAMLGRKVAPPRFVMFAVVLIGGMLGYHALIPDAHWADSAATAFDLAATIFVVSLVPFLRQSGPAAIRKHADANDANRLLILIMTTVLTIAVMVTIAGELPGARQGDGWAILRLVGTLLLIWLFANTVFALHYAHEYYSKQPDCSGDNGGLDFPGEGDPGYAEFVYFSFTLGMTFQTSDVAITARRIRAVVLLHCFAAFVFNLGVIAFTINALGGSSG